MRDLPGRQCVFVATLSAASLTTVACGGVSTVPPGVQTGDAAPDSAALDATAPVDDATVEAAPPDDATAGTSMGPAADTSTPTIDAGHCGDGFKDGDETDIDCGGATCGPCAAGKGCAATADCAAGAQCLLAACNAKAPPIDSALVGYWPLDKDLKDVSGQQNDGTAFNATPAVGKVGGSYQVAGNGCLLVPHAASLAMVGGDTMTMMAWVNYAGSCPATGQDRAIVLNLESSYEMGIACGTNLFQDAIQPLAFTWGWEGTMAVTVNAWQHLAVVWDGATVLHYVNGQPFDSRALAGQLSDRGLGLGMGCRNVAADGTSTNVGSFFEGLVDEVAVYSRALSATEIQAYYAATK
jgi:Concanavalin A-like lectin/glucanases superfamily